MSISITYDTSIPTSVSDSSIITYPIIQSDYATAKTGCVRYMSPMAQMNQTQFQQFFKTATNATYMSMLDIFLNMSSTKSAILAKYNFDMGLTGSDMKEIIAYTTNGMSALSTALNACDVTPITITPSTATVKNYFQIIFKFTCGTGLNTRTYTVGCEWELVA